MASINSNLGNTQASTMAFMFNVELHEDFVGSGQMELLRILDEFMLFVFDLC
jgi:hypothetical protein